jgi:hypothetical protein
LDVTSKHQLTSRISEIQTVETVTEEHRAKRTTGKEPKMKRVKSFTAQALKGLLQTPSRMRHDRLGSLDDGWMEVMLEGAAA